MSKHLKKKNPPVASSDEDESANQDLPTPGAVDPVTATTAGAVVVPETDGAGAASSSSCAADGWQHVAEQLDSLHADLLQLVTLVVSSVATERPQNMSLRSGEQGHLQGISEGPPWELTAAIMHAVDATRREAAILGADAEVQSEPAISPEPRGGPPCGAAAAKCGGVGHSHRLPHIKEFVAVGGD
ncbi:unnamed protein product [Lampetra planeri]